MTGKEQDEQIRDFVEYIINLTPNEVAIIASAIGIIIGQPLTPMQQNLFGGFLQLVGQELLTMYTQAAYVQATNDPNYNPKIINNVLPRKRNQPF